MISVLMCTYNREHFLKRAIDSVLNQTYREIEFIIVDDGSTDHTEELVKAYDDTRIRYLKMEKNSFYCYAANYGLLHCKGEYIAFMNSDDVWMPEKLEKQLAFLEEKPEYGACFSAVKLINDQGEDITDECPEMRDLFAKQYESQKECVQYLLKYRNSLCHPSAVVRKEILDKTGGFNLMFCQLADYDLWMRLITEAPVYVMEEHLIQFRWDMTAKDQISIATVENAVRAFNEQVLIRKQFVERLTDEQFKSFLGDWFKNKDSSRHLELEFEKAFILAECLSDAPDLKVLGIEKMEQVMKEPKAMDVLRNHFQMDIFDLYRWNKDHMYWTPWLEREFQRVKATAKHQENLIGQKNQHIEDLKQSIKLQEELIDQKEQHIINLEQSIKHQEELIRLKEQHIINLEQYCKMYENSMSWKVTKPLRNFMRMVRNKKQ